MQSASGKGVERAEGFLPEGHGMGEKKNPAELPASRPNSGAGTEKRPLSDQWNE
jgi:hypothetical protein